MKKQWIVFLSLSGMLFFLSCGAMDDEALPAYLNSLCTDGEMVWYDAEGVETRRDYNCSSEQTSASGFCYSFIDDLCSGYRCVEGNDVSSTCLSETDCQASCGGTCVSISSMNTRCTTNLCTSADMVWNDADGTETRRDDNCASGSGPVSIGGFCYDFTVDTCTGYRCVEGSDVSSICLSETDCQVSCGGTCLSIPSMDTLCTANLCTTVDMVWYDGEGVETRRDYNCASGETSASGFCYDFASDTCSAYRCSNGSEISSSCLSDTECQASCTATCLSIPDMNTACAGP